MSRKNTNRFAALLAEDESAPNSPETQPTGVTNSTLENIPTVDISGSVIPPITKPPSPPPEPELTEEEKKAIEEEKQYQIFMEENYYKPAREARKKALMEFFESEDYWKDRLASLERQRCKYNKKAAWSADDLMDVEQLDADIREAEEELFKFRIDEEEEENEEEIYSY